MPITRVAAGVAAIVTVLLLQASLIGPLTFPAPVSLPCLFVVIVGIYAGPGLGQGLGFVTGLLADLTSQHPVGVQALCWLGAGLAGGLLGGLAVERGHRARGVALWAAGIGTVTSVATLVLLTLLDSHAASVGFAVRNIVPVALGEAVLGLAVAPVVRWLLASQAIAAARPRATVVGHG